MPASVAWEDLKVHELIPHARTILLPNIQHTFVPPHPSLNAASCANSSPNPSMSPLTKGKNRLIAAPRNKPQIVGGEYKIIGELDDDGGDGESSSGAEYCSLSEGIVMEDSKRLGDSEAIFTVKTLVD